MLKRLAVVAVVLAVLPLLFPSGAEAQGPTAAARLAVRALARARPQQIASVAAVLPLGRSLTPAEIIRRLEGNESFQDQFLSEAVQLDPVSLRALLATSGEMSAEDALRIVYLQRNALARTRNAITDAAMEAASGNRPIIREVRFSRVIARREPRRFLQ